MENGTKKTIAEKKKMKELKLAFDSATSGDEMGKAMLNMQESGLFDDKGLGFETWKLAEISIQDNNNSSFVRSSERKNNKLRKAFHSAKSTDEMLKAFQKMESRFEEKDLGFECWKLIQRIHKENGDPEKILRYGKRALNYLVDRNKDNNRHVSFIMMITNTLPIVASACCKLKRFEESLIYLKWSQRNLDTLESDTSFPADLLFTSLGGTQFRFAVVNAALGRGAEALIHVKKIMEYQDKLNTKGCVYPELGNVNLRIDQVIHTVVKELKSLGVSEQDEAVKLLKASLVPAIPLRRTQNMVFKGLCLA